MIFIFYIQTSAKFFLENGILQNKQAILNGFITSAPDKKCRGGEMHRVVTRRSQMPPVLFASVWTSGAKLVYQRLGGV